MPNWKYEVKVYTNEILDSFAGGAASLPGLQSEIHAMQDRGYELHSVLPKSAGDGYVAIFRHPITN